MPYLTCFAGYVCLNTLWLLLGMYEGRPFITADELARDFFQHLSAEKFVRKVDAGDIDIPLIRIEDSSKAARGVHIRDFGGLPRQAGNGGARAGGQDPWPSVGFRDEPESPLRPRLRPTQAFAPWVRRQCYLAATGSNHLAFWP